jgi:glycosyltransferase involved in cell wall biosynthesis
MKRPRVLLVANVLTHYRLPLYESLQDKVDLQIIFYSDGGEWYWQRTEQPSGDSLHRAVWLKGRWLGHTRITPGLIAAVLRADVDVIIKDPNGKFALPVTYAVARLRRKPFVFWASMWTHPAAGLHRFTRPLMRYLYRHSDWVVTYGRHVSRFVVSEGARPDCVSESPQAVTAQPSPPPTSERWTTPAPLLYVGRLERWKGVDILLRALAELPDDNWRLTIAGDGAERESLMQLADQLRLSGSVRFLGKVPNRDLAVVYQQSAAVIVPSVATPQVTEVWSLVVNEAMQAGALVVATDAVGAAADGLVTHERTGLVSAANDVAALAATLRKMFATDREELAAIAAEGQRRVAHYTHERAAQAFADAATNVLRPRGEADA